MNTLEEALEHASPFPGGLFWLHRGEGNPLDRVCGFLSVASEKGVDGGLVRVENFDEALRDLVRLIPDLDTTQMDEFASERSVVSSPPRISGKRGYPVIRLNGIEVKSLPTICRRVECDIGGYKEVEEAIGAAGVDVLATRSAKGVLAFGADSDLRAALANVTIKEFDLHEIEKRRLRYDSQERGLLKQALSRSLAREHGLTLKHRRSVDFLAPADVTDQRWGSLKRIVGGLSGNVAGQPDLNWQEGIAVRLEWADDKLWLVFEPRILMNGTTEDNRAAATDFSRERSVKRYNRQLNDLTSFWSDLLSANGRELRALNVSTGVDASFSLGTTTAFSKRSRP